MQEICLLGWDSQVTTASEILVAAVVSEGKYGNIGPCSSSQRGGATSRAFVRISDQPIRVKTPIDNTDCVIVMEPVIKTVHDIYQGLREMGTMVINVNKPPHELSIPSQVTRMGLVDASQIAKDILRVDITYSVMLGAFAKTTGLVSLRAILENLTGHFPSHILKAHRSAAEQGYDSTMVVEFAQ